MAELRLRVVGVVVLVLGTRAAWADPLTTPVADAFLNLGQGPFADQDTITTGNAQPWYQSSQLAPFFGGQPGAAQQADFDATVLQRVEQTFQQSGVPVRLTEDPSVAAAHTLSLVSNTAAASLPTAIGMTELGGNGFSFIDPITHSAQSLDQLEWIVAHNIAHELMIAFGVGENYDHTGSYIDAPQAGWAMMTSPDSVFSAAAAEALRAQGLGATASAGAVISQAPAAEGTANGVGTEEVPEPETWLVWGLAATALALAHRRRRPTLAAA